MSDTPRTDAASFNGETFDWTVDAGFARQLEREIAGLQARLDYVRGLGVVNVFPKDWDSWGAGGPPEIGDYEIIDLSDV